MTVWQSYVLGFLTPFGCLVLAGCWMWVTEESTKWWRDKQPSFGRLRCTVAGHRYLMDNTWVICSRCGHVKRDPSNRDEALRTYR